MVSCIYNNVLFILVGRYTMIYTFLLFLYWVPLHWPIRNHTLQWRNNARDGVSDYRRLDCLLNRLFSRRSKKTSKLRVIGLCDGNPPVTGGFPHKGPVTRKMFSFDDVIMRSRKTSWTRVQLSTCLPFHNCKLLGKFHSRESCGFATSLGWRYDVLSLSEKGS